MNGRPNLLGIRLWHCFVNDRALQKCKIFLVLAVVVCKAGMEIQIESDPNSISKSDSLIRLELCCAS